MTDTNAAGLAIIEATVARVRAGDKAKLAELVEAFDNIAAGYEALAGLLEGEHLRPFLLSSATGQSTLADLVEDGDLEGLEELLAEARKGAS